MENNGCYIGIDPATKTSPAGLVCLDKQFAPVGYLLIDPELPPSGYARAGHRWDPLFTYRIDFIGAEVKLFLDTHPNIEAVFIEEPRLLGKANKNMLKLLGVLENVIWNTYLSAVPIFYIDPSTSKKWVGGHGSADKDQVLAGVLKMTKCKKSDFIRSGQICYDLSDAAAAIIAGLKVSTIR